VRHVTGRELQPHDVPVNSGIVPPARPGAIGAAIDWIVRATSVTELELRIGWQKDPGVLRKPGMMPVPEIEFSVGCVSSDVPLRSTVSEPPPRDHFDWAASMRILPSAAASLGNSFCPAGKPLLPSRNARMSAFCPRLSFPG
jgi:hypothetical protein